MKKPLKANRRKSEILRELSRLSRNGWNNAVPEEYEPLERELRAINGLHRPR